MDVGKAETTAAEPPVPAAATAQVLRFLHVNLNCVDVDASIARYTDLFGLREVMRSAPEGADGTAMGVAEPTYTTTVFLYDDRGGRRSPALELVGWHRPPTSGDHYARVDHVGMQSVAYDVPPGTPVWGPSDGPGVLEIDGAHAAALWVDPDGVPVEVYESATVETPKSRHVRLVVSSLERSVAWYRAIGFEVAAPPAEHSWRWAPAAGEAVAGTVRSARLVMPRDESYALELTEWLEPASVGTPHDFAADRGLYRMALGVADTRAAAGALRDAGWPHVGEPAYFALPGTPIEGMWIAFLRDPDGITIEFVERPVDVYRT